MKEIKITYWTLAPDNSLRELWHTEPVNGFATTIGRDAYGDKLWHELTDELEKLCNFPEDVIFIICDSDFNEITRQSNNLQLHFDRFPTLVETCKAAWLSISDDYPGVAKDDWHKWIRRLAPDNMSSTFMTNWYDCDRKVIKTEVLSDFQYLGKNFHIIRHCFKHTKCEAVWYEYFAAPEHLVKSGPYLLFLGYQWD